MSKEMCNFVLNETSHCICKTSHHNMWNFGIRRVNHDKDFIYFDDANYVYKYRDYDDFSLSESHYNLFRTKDNTNEDITNEDITNENITNEDITNEEYSKEGKYFLNCNCNYCTYSKNKYLNIFNECFCCKKHLYIKNNMYDVKDFIHCYNCNSILCHNCFVQGRYNDEEELYCFECRRFSIHKNQYFYFGDNINTHDDWMNASWYY